METKQTQKPQDSLENRKAIDAFEILECRLENIESARKMGVQSRESGRDWQGAFTRDSDGWRALRKHV